MDHAVKPREVAVARELLTLASVGHRKTALFRTLAQRA